MATNQVEDGRLVREGGHEYQPCHDCIWYRAVTMEGGDCKRPDDPKVTRVWATCGSWVSHKQLGEKLARIEKLTLEAQAEQRRRAARTPYPGVPGVHEFTEQAFPEGGNVLEGERRIDEDTIAEIDAAAQAKFAAGFEAGLLEGPR